MVEKESCQWDCSKACNKGNSIDPRTRLVFPHVKHTRDTNKRKVIRYCKVVLNSPLFVKVGGSAIPSRRFVRTSVVFGGSRVVGYPVGLSAMKISVNSGEYNTAAMLFLDGMSMMLAGDRVCAHWQSLCRPSGPLDARPSDV